MAGAKEIRRKIASIKNTGKITKAMELISTVKMKKAQDSVMAKKEIVLEILKIFVRIEDSLSGYPLFENGKGEKTLAVMITSNKGLCGGYNIGVMKKVNSYIKETNEDINFITVGRKAANFISRTGHNLIADFSHDFTDDIKPFYTKRISRLLREEFMSGAYKKVVVFYSHFVNTIKQIPLHKEFLPISAVDIKEYLSEIIIDSYDIEEELKKDMESQIEYRIEPSKEELAEHIIPIILDMMFYDLLLESKASEHSARMIAMKNAKDNSSKIAGNLTLMFNKARQAVITREVTEITSGVESLKD